MPLFIELKQQRGVFLLDILSKLCAVSVIWISSMNLPQREKPQAFRLADEKVANITQTHKSKAEGLQNYSMSARAPSISATVAKVKSLWLICR